MMSIQPNVAIEPLLTREAAADLLDMSVSWIKKEIREGRLVAVKLGKLVRIEPQALRDFIFQYRSGVGKNVGTPSIPGLFGPDTEKFYVSGKKRG